MRARSSSAGLSKTCFYDDIGAVIMATFLCAEAFFSSSVRSRMCTVIDTVPFNSTLAWIPGTLSVVLWKLMSSCECLFASASKTPSRNPLSTSCSPLPCSSVFFVLMLSVESAEIFTSFPNGYCDAKLVFQDKESSGRRGLKLSFSFTKAIASRH